MKKLGLFGGTFDPIHNGHLHIAKIFAQQLNLDCVIFLPAGDPYHKNKPHTTTDVHHRIAMIEAAIANGPLFAVSDVDLRAGKTYTIDTIQIFKQHFTQTQWWFLMGMDSLLQLHTWKNWQSLVKQTNIAVAARQGSILQNAPPALHQWLGEALNNHSLVLLDAPEYPVSSTQIRQALQQKQDTKNWLPEKVTQYIQQHQLYQ